MEELHLDFSDEELREIISSPGYGAEVIFAEGYELADAYPSLGEWDVEGTLEMSSHSDQIFPWGAEVGKGSNWVISCTVAASGSLPVVLCPLHASDQMRASTRGFRGRQAA